MNWHAHIRRVTPHVVRISTPTKFGTGFLVKREGNSAAICTAAHVVRDACAWKQTITVEHPAFPAPIPLLPVSRAIDLHWTLDSAILSVSLPDGVGDAFPEEPIELVPLQRSVKPGVEVGWLGFPYLVPNSEPCFFSGHVSAHMPDTYFIDGVAIEGVSGGPTFFYNAREKQIRILGSITAYRPAHREGAVLPGLMIATEVRWALGD